LLTVTLIASVASSASFAHNSGQEGIGYNSLASRGSPTAQAAQALPSSVGIASMNGPRIYVVTRRSPVAEIPWVNRFSTPDTVPRRIDKLKAEVESGRISYLVYFYSDSGFGVVKVRELAAAGLRLRKVANYPDGSVWEPLPK